MLRVQLLLYQEDSVVTQGSKERAVKVHCKLHANVSHDVSGEGGQGNVKMTLEALVFTSPISPEEIETYRKMNPLILTQEHPDAIGPGGPSSTPDVIGPGDPRSTHNPLDQKDPGALKQQ
ncbi:hypothetical protein STEG23_002634 [Scotinomys teguina]